MTHELGGRFHQMVRDDTDTRGRENTAGAITMKPIGFVEPEQTEEELQRNRANVLSGIVVDRRYEDALRGIDGYSHLIVLFW